MKIKSEKANRFYEVKSLEERFWGKVNKTPTCWLWTGPSVSRSGHGQITERIATMKRKYRMAHRVSWEIHNGKIPFGLQVNHKTICMNPKCVNPEHLYLGTQKENCIDNVKAGKTCWITRRRKGV